MIMLGKEKRGREGEGEKGRGKEGGRERRGKEGKGKEGKGKERKGKERKGEMARYGTGNRTMGISPVSIVIVIIIIILTRIHSQTLNPPFNHPTPLTFPAHAHALALAPWN